MIFTLVNIFQSISQRSQSASGGQPSISITPLSGRSSATIGKPLSNQQSTQPDAQRSGKAKRDIVICEICDGYIKDLEQLKNHMQWIHKVSAESQLSLDVKSCLKSNELTYLKVQIHPKMIYNRPPLNCQKCQHRFFTDQVF